MHCLRYTSACYFYFPRYFSDYEILAFECSFIISYFHSFFLFFHRFMNLILSYSFFQIRVQMFPVYLVSFWSFTSYCFFRSKFEQFLLKVYFFLSLESTNSINFPSNQCFMGGKRCLHKNRSIEKTGSNECEASTSTNANASTEEE